MPLPDHHVDLVVLVVGAPFHPGLLGHEGIELIDGVSRFFGGLEARLIVVVFVAAARACSGSDARGLRDDRSSRAGAHENVGVL